VFQRTVDESDDNPLLSLSNKSHEKTLWIKAHYKSRTVADEEEFSNIE
jgi:hypothetical protein